MKKGLLAFFALASVFGAGTANAQLQLNATIQNTAGEFAATFERNEGVAVLSMHGESARMSDHIITEMIVAFIGMQHVRGITVVNRMQLNTFAAQLNFNTTDPIDDETARYLGILMNVRYLVTGTFERRAGFVRLNLQVTDVETPAIHARYAYVPIDGLVVSLMGAEYVPTPLTRQERRELREPPPPALQDTTRFWSAGVSGTLSLMEPTIARGFSVQATLAPFRHSFFRIGCDFLFGGSSYHRGVEFSARSITPFVHYAWFQPFPRGRGGFHIGAGPGLVTTSFDISGDIQNVSDSFLVVDVVAGIYLLGWLSVSYTFRTNFSRYSDRLSIGLNYRLVSRGDR